MVYEYEQVISDELCDTLIRICDSSLQQMTTLGKEIDGYRTAQGCWISRTSDESEKILELMSRYTGYPIDNMESCHLVKYDVGGEYKEHHDFFHPGEEYYEGCMKQGGQRVKSCLIYLNDDFIGGQTYFPALNRVIEPKKGKMVIWDNFTEDDLLDYDSIHAGLPVRSGKKYILIVWIRRNKFI